MGKRKRFDKNKVCLYNRYHEKSYAFLLDLPSYPKVLMLEVSNRTKIDKMMLRFFGNKVVYVPKIMECLLVRRLDEETQRFLEVAMVNLIQRGVENEYKHIHESLIDSIIRQKISNKFKYASRSNSKIMKNVYFSFQNFRCRRMEEESHLPMIFYQDLQRSLGELKYCFTLMLKSKF